MSWVSLTFAGGAMRHSTDLAAMANSTISLINGPADPIKHPATLLPGLSLLCLFFSPLLPLWSQLACCVLCVIPDRQFGVCAHVCVCMCVCVCKSV